MSQPLALRRWPAALLAAGGLILIAVVDFISGVELRVFPLYYLPIAFAAWQFGRMGASVAATVSAIGWFSANQLAGLQFSHPAIWVANTIMQGTSFAVVGLLVAQLHGLLLRERELSRIDPLSSLLNRRAFYQESQRLMALCRRGRRPITLAYLDLDDFKLVNDRFGHQAGDETLRAIASVLQQSIRSSDLAARLGGDEFAVLLPELGPDEARQALDRLGAAIASSVRNLGPPVTVSVGAVTFLVIPDDVETMVHEADALMYSAKREGKDRVVLQVANATMLGSAS